MTNMDMLVMSLCCYVLHTALQTCCQLTLMLQTSGCFAYVLQWPKHLKTFRHNRHNEVMLTNDIGHRCFSEAKESVITRAS